MNTIVTRVLRGVYLLTLSALLIFPASFAHAVPIPTVYDFDETDYETLLSDSFNAGSALTDFDYDVDDGIADTGSIFTNETSNIWTAQQPYEAPNTVDQEYVISGFFHNSGNTGYGGLGFSPDATSTLSDEHPVASRGMGISFHGVARPAHHRDASAQYYFCEHGQNCIVVVGRACDDCGVYICFNTNCKSQSINSNRSPLAHTFIDSNI